MRKTMACLIISMISAACSQQQTHYRISAENDDTLYLKDISGCPKVHIRPKNTEIIQSEAGKELFKISVVGYQGYCYFNEKTGRHRAVVKPNFEIRRLNESDVTDVHFSYYIETVEGPSKYLGRKTYFTEAKIVLGAPNTFHTAKGGELSIPEPGLYNNDIYLGLNANKLDSETKI